MSGILFLFPITLCVYLMAEFKRKSIFIWPILTISTPLLIYILRIFTISASLLIIYILQVLTILAPPLIYILISFFTPRWPLHKIDSYRAKFTTEYDRISYSLLAGISIVLIGLFVFQLSKGTENDIYQNFWFYIHGIFTLITYSSIIVLFILGISRFIKNGLFPKVALIIQLLAIISLYVGIIVGSIWAKIVFGRLWGWDPKETWSLILLYMMFANHTFITFSVPKKVKTLLVFTVQMALVFFISYSISTLLPSLWGFNYFLIF